MYHDAPKPYYPPPGQQMPADQNYSPSAPPKPPQQYYGAQYEYAQPSQQVPWQQYAQPGRQMPYQQQPAQPMPYQYYPQNTAPQYNPIVAPPIQPSNPHMNMPLRQWSSELFDCAQDPENCKFHYFLCFLFFSSEERYVVTNVVITGGFVGLITACCPCITFAQIAEITDRGMTRKLKSSMFFSY